MREPYNLIRARPDFKKFLKKLQLEFDSPNILVVQKRIMESHEEIERLVRKKKHEEFPF